jgi:adenylate cyclase class 2
MAVEIELKTRIDEPEDLKNRLNSLGNYDCAYEKADIYWSFAEKKAGIPPELDKKNEGPASPGLFLPILRVRREINTGKDGRISTASRVTYKFREMREEIEINDEREFEVSDAACLEDMLRRLGLRPDIIKNKRGWAWYCGEKDKPLRAELSDVQGLGWYLELEILAPSKTDQILAEGREQLFSVLEGLGIPRSRIEVRPYTEMLKALRQT